MNYRPRLDKDEPKVVDKGDEASILKMKMSETGRNGY
jgi:hypothetical protein